MSTKKPEDLDSTQVDQTLPASDVGLDVGQSALDMIAHVPPPPPPPPRLALGIDLDALRIDPEADGDAGGTVDVVTGVHLGKPKADWFFRTHSDWIFRARLYKDEEDRGQLYFVHPAVVPLIQDRVNTYEVVFAATLTGEPFFWPLKQPGGSGKPDRWTESARVAAATAKQSWVRMSADMAAQHYKVVRAVAAHMAPKWPTDIDALFAKAVEGNFIDGPDHPIVARLLGK